MTKTYTSVTYHRIKLIFNIENSKENKRKRKNEEEITNSCLIDRDTSECACKTIVCCVAPYFIQQ